MECHSDKGKWERGAGTEGEEESLPGCGTTAMVVYVERKAAHTPSQFSVFSSIPDATNTSRGTLLKETNAIIKLCN